VLEVRLKWSSACLASISTVKKQNKKKPYKTARITKSPYKTARIMIVELCWLLFGISFYFSGKKILHILHFRVNAFLIASS
jgi:hypothetical protein